MDTLNNNDSGNRIEKSKKDYDYSEDYLMECPGCGKMKWYPGEFNGGICTECENDPHKDF